MKRRVIQLVLLLIAGAIVNVAVAWGCAALLNPHQVLMRAEFNVYVNGNPPHLIGRQKQIGHTRINRLVGDLHETPKPYVTDQVPGLRSEDHAGWPFLSLVCYNYGDLRFNAPNHRRTRYLDPDRANVVGGIELPKWKEMPNRRATQPPEFYYVWRALPCLPLWPGFAINTIFYAAILWAVFFVPGKLKRTLRRRRGLCPACAYPIGTSPVCTECGIYLSGGYQW